MKNKKLKNKYRRPIMACYIDIGNSTSEEADKVLKKAKKNLKKGLSKKERKEYVRIVIPMRGRKTSRIEIL